MARWLSDDVVEIGPAFDHPLVGKRDFFAKYQSYIHGPTNILLYRILRPRTLRLSPRLVLVHFQYRMRTERSGVTEASRGKESMLIEKKRGRWYIRFIHWHRDELVAQDLLRGEKNVE